MNWRRPLYFFGHRLIGSRVAHHYREFLEMEFAPETTLTGVRQERLHRLLRWAKEHIPFYRERVFSENPALEDFPVLRKETIQENFFDLMASDLRTQVERGTRGFGYSWTEVKSGGSTGEPTTVIHDAELRDRGRASRLYGQHLCGFPLGTPYFMLWGSMRDIDASRESLQKRVLNSCLNTRILNAFQMNEARMQQYIQLINDSPIQHLMGYADACDQLSRFIQQRGLEIKPLKSIMLCGGTVTPDMAERLARTFSARVHNKYGSRDCTDLACQCAEGGFHIFGHHVCLEVVDEQDAPLPPGQSGRILVTLLSNYQFPLIRYDIGDVGALSDSKCHCGRSFPLLERVEGRTLERLTDTRGNFVTGIYIRHLIGVVHNPNERIRRFQLNQYSHHKYELLLEVQQSWSAEVQKKTGPNIQRDLLSVLGADANLEIKIVDHIEATGSGKFLYLRNLSGHTN